VAERLAVELDVDAVGLRETQQEVAGHPHLVGGLSGALAKDLEFPLALGHLGIDAFVVDAGGETEFEMLLDDLARDGSDILEPDARIIWTLRCGVAFRRETQGTAVLVEEVLLLE